MSDTNRVGLRYAKTSRTVFPINPAPTVLDQLRYTGTPSLAFAPQTVQSAEIRSDRQVTDLALIGGQAGGDVDFELSAQAFDPFLASVVFSSWTDPPAVEGTTAISTIVRTSGKTVVTTAASNAFLAGHVVKLSGGPEVGNGVFAVESKAGNALTLIPVDGVQVTGTFTVTASTRLAVVGFQAENNGDLDIEVSGGSLTVVAASSTFNNLMGSSANLVPGQWIKIAGAAGSANNVWMRLTSVTNRRLTGDAPTGAVAETVAGKLAVYFGGYVRNPASPEAIANHTYLIERRFEDHSPVEREVFVGMVLDQFQLTLEQAAIATGKMIWFGNSAEIDETVANLFSATPTDREAPTGSVLNSANNVARLGLGADQIDQGNVNAVLSANLTLANNLRRQGAVRHFGSVGSGLGAISATGQITTYFDSRAHLNRLLKNLETSLDFVFTSGEKEALLIDLPRIKFASGAPEVAGQNQDVTLPLTYQALRDATLGYTIHFQRSEYAS